MPVTLPTGTQCSVDEANSNTVTPPTGYRWTTPYESFTETNSGATTTPAGIAPLMGS